MSSIRAFTLIDFYESLSAIDAVKVDFDNSYPHQTQKLYDWCAVWSPTLLARAETDRKTFFQAIPTKNGLLVANLSPDRLHPIRVHWLVDRPEVLLAVAIIINLSQCTSFQSLSTILTHFRKDEWTLDAVVMTLDDFTHQHQDFYRALKEQTYDTFIH